MLRARWPCFAGPGNRTWASFRVAMRRCADAPSITTLTPLPTAILNPIVVLVETDQEMKRGDVRDRTSPLVRRGGARDGSGRRELPGVGRIVGVADCGAAVERVAVI